MDWSGLNANSLKSFPGYENNHDVTISEKDTEMTVVLQNIFSDKIQKIHRKHPQWSSF